MVNELKIGDTTIVVQVTYYVYQSDNARKNDNPYLITSDIDVIKELKKKLEADNSEDIEESDVSLINNRQRSIESIGLMNLKEGQFFYTRKKDKDITAIAGYYGKKVKTERLFVINPQSGETERVVKVTIV